MKKLEASLPAAQPGLSVGSKISLADVVINHNIREYFDDKVAVRRESANRGRTFAVTNSLIRFCRLATVLLSVLNYSAYTTMLSKRLLDGTKAGPKPNFKTLFLQSLVDRSIIRDDGRDSESALNDHPAAR